uniref:deoxyguanosine kinase n=1 Tax=Callorhinchus milii TaxID=7868 RepID=V9KW63_CALMI
MGSRPRPKRLCPAAASVQNPLHTPRLTRVAIEGNIAVGKSTFAKMLEMSTAACEVVHEPIAKWQNIRASNHSEDSSSSALKSTGNLLQMMYEDPHRWSYTFQSYSCMSRIEAQLKPVSARLLNTENSVQIFERSVYSDRYIFASNMYDLGYLNETEWTIYQDWHTYLINQFGNRIALEGIIYLQASPEKCLERIQQRARVEEKEIQVNYLQQLHDKHEDWLVKRTMEVHFDHLKNVPMLVLDMNEDFEEDKLKQNKLLEQVKNFMHSLRLDGRSL